MYRDALGTRFSDPVNQRIALRRLPAQRRCCCFGGIVVTLVVRRWLMRWVDHRLLATASGRAAAWIVALRNLSRLIVPVVAAGLLFAALDPEGLVARAGEGRFFEIPGFVLILIGAFWLAASLFAPRLEAHRLLPLDNREARRGAWLVVLLGCVVALARYAAWAITRFDFSPDTQTAIFFPLVLRGRRRAVAGGAAHRQGPAPPDGARRTWAVADDGCSACGSCRRSRGWCASSRWRGRCCRSWATCRRGRSSSSPAS